MRRRTVLAGAVASFSFAAGCLGDDPPDPVAIPDNAFDDDHGMEIGPHGGANAQVFYEDQMPSAREEGPFWFHTLSFSLFPFHFERLQRGWEEEVIYVTDFSAVDWTVEERDAGPTMPSPTDASTFADATELSYVIESEVRGGMGPDLHPFSDTEEAESFVDDFGGRIIDFDDIDAPLIDAIQEEGDEGHDHSDDHDHGDDHDHSDNHDHGDET